MASVWQNNKLLRKWERKHFKENANGDFNYNLAYPLEDPLVNAISNYINVKKDYIYVGSGISQFINTIVGLNMWGKIILPEIEFALYKRTALLHEKKLILIKGLHTEDFVNNLKKLKTTDKDLLCISSPRWFDGEKFTQKQIKDILNIYNGTLIIDEVYVDYSDDENGMLDICLKMIELLYSDHFQKNSLLLDIELDIW